jgi:aminoglycoside phosphotransferase (APT) family kinase protein
VPPSTIEVHDRLVQFLGMPAITGVEAISDGWETEVFRFDLHGKDGVDRRMILRIYPGELDVAERAALEFRVMDHLGQAGFPVPMVLHLGQDRSWFGGPFLIMERIVGPQLGRQFFAAPESERPGILAGYCRLWVRLHNLDTSRFIGPDRVWPDAVAACTTHEPAWIMGKIRASSVSEAFEPLLQWLQERGKSVALDHSSVLHGDFHMWNILLRENGAPAVIDWSFCGVGDPRFDVAYPVIILQTEGAPGLARAIREGYEAASGAPLQDFDYFEAFQLARRLGVMVMAMAGEVAKLGLRPELGDHLRQHVGDVHGVYEHVVQRTGIDLPGVKKLLDSWT